MTEQPSAVCAHSKLNIIVTLLQMKPSDERVLEHETTLDDPESQAASRGSASVSQGCDSDEAPPDAVASADEPQLCPSSFVMPEPIVNTVVSNGAPVHSLWSIITGGNKSDDNKYEWQVTVAVRFLCPRLLDMMRIS